MPKEPRELKVPYALNAEGQVLAALTAPREGAYTCLDCAQPLVLRRRYGYRAHFTHLPDALVVCSGESATHQAAKRLLQEQIKAELEREGKVAWLVKCAGVQGGCRDGALLPHHHTPAAWDDVRLEVAHGDFRFDVAVTHLGRVMFGFEVFFRHAVPEAKAVTLDVPWLELLAEDILAFKPRIPFKSTASECCRHCEALALRLSVRALDDEERQRITEAYYCG